MEGCYNPTFGPPRAAPAELCGNGELDEPLDTGTTSESAPPRRKDMVWVPGRARYEKDPAVCGKRFRCVGDAAVAGRARLASTYAGAPPRADCAPPKALCAVPEAECAVPEAECAVLEAECAVLEAECAVPEAGCAVMEAECAVPEAGCLS